MARDKQQELIRNRVSVVTWLLRVFVFLATLTAAILMGVNKQTKTIVVGVVGNTLITKTFTAMFLDDPAYEFFLIANAIGALHNLLTLLADILGNNFDPKGIRHTMTPIFDVLVVALLATGIGGAAFVGAIAEHGNSSARWEKICDTFPLFCMRAVVAFAVSLAGVVALFIIVTISIIKLKRRNIAAPP